MSTVCKNCFRKKYEPMPNDICAEYRDKERPAITKENTPEQIADAVVVTFLEQELSADELRQLIADVIREERGELQ